MISSTIDSFTVNLVYHGKGDTNTIKEKRNLHKIIISESLTIKVISQYKTKTNQGWKHRLKLRNRILGGVSPNDCIIT